MTGVGVDDAHRRHRRTCCRRAPVTPTGAPSGTVFKIERGPKRREDRARSACSPGTLTIRDRVRLGDDESDRRRPRHRDPRVRTRHDDAAPLDASPARSPRSRGLTDARIGDRFGAAGDRAPHHAFAPPTLETAVVPRDPSDKPALFAALTELAEQDPLINLRQDDTRQELFLSLYGEVQREIVAQTLAAEHGIEVEFRSVTPICVERPERRGIRDRDDPAPPVAAPAVPRHRRPDGRAAAARLGRDVRARRQGRGDPDARVRHRRRVPRRHGAHGARHAAPGPPRLGGHRLRGDDDARPTTRHRPAGGPGPRSPTTGS